MSEGGDITILKRFDHESLTTRSFPKRAFAAVVALTVAVVAGETWAGWKAYDGARDVATAELRLRQVAGNIARFDEAMATSVRMSVVTGDVSWEKRYREQESALAAAVKEATSLAPEAYKSDKVVQARAADTRVASLNTEAFGLVRAGRNREAMAILSTAWCDEQRAIHAAGMTASLEAMNARSAGRVESQALRTLLTLLGCIVATAGVAFAWWKVLLAMRGDAAGDVQGALRATKERLELHVKERGRALDDKNREMRLVLDNVNQGLLILDENGVIGAQRSAIVGQWFPRTPTGMTLWDFLADVDPGASALSKLAWEQLKADMMPIELSLDMLPKKLVIGRNVFDVSYQPIMTRGTLDHLLVVMSDATPQLERERLEGEQRELMSIFEHIVKDRPGVIAFSGELKDLVQKATADDVSVADRRRYIHTLKGNCAMFGATHLSTLCHQIEDRMAEEGGMLSERDRGLLAEAWKNVSKKLEVLVGDESNAAMEIDKNEYASVMRMLLDGKPQREIAKEMAQWSLEPVRLHVARFAARARAVAERLGKTDVTVTGDAGNLRLAPERWAPFWSAFVHVVTNAVDHGIETDEERELAGKSCPGQIELKAFESTNEVVIELIDDGRGIDWERVAAKAKARGLPAATHEDLVEALFADGVSTKDSATEISGRGAGLGAVRQECSRMGGSVDVVSVPGKGTHFCFRIPLDKPFTQLAKAA